MLRLIYSLLLRLHPARFRNRFGDEMMSIFDQAEAKETAWVLFVDAFISLVRQWAMRWQRWDDKAVPTALTATHGVPVFITLENYKPRKVALITGVAVTWFACATLFFGLSHSKVHAVWMPHVSFEKNFLRSVEFKHHGFGDALSGILIQDEQQYVNDRNRLSVDAIYDDEIADNIAKELKDFWKRRGVNVEIRTDLVQVPMVAHDVLLEVHIYKK